MIKERVLIEKKQVEKVERLVKRIEFSIYFRNKNIEQHQQELKAVEKIERFLEQDSNKKFVETSNIWKSMLSTVKQHITQFEQTIKDGEESDKREIAFLEQVKDHIYDYGYDLDFFTSLLLYADVNRDTDNFDPTLEMMMKETGFLDENTTEKAD